MNYKECPYCHAHLDFGEVCDCRTKKETAPLHRETVSGDKPPVAIIKQSKPNCKAVIT